MTMRGPTQIVWSRVMVIERVEDGKSMVKLVRACGGCLGTRRQSRAWKTAISPVEVSNNC